MKGHMLRSRKGVKDGIKWGWVKDWRGYRGGYEGVVECRARGTWRREAAALVTAITHVTTYIISTKPDLHIVEEKQEYSQLDFVVPV